ncbi:MAG TPA: ornithine cyclodeaminase family protein [Planctomycetota bacterium]|nr:ornithine cyclodeaminase family protein [Planctomycetota bacterium]
MRIIELEAIRKVLDFAELIDRMREALVAQARGECDTPMPMHLSVPPERAEIHVKGSYRRGGEYFGLKIASTFPNNRERGLSVSNGMMLLLSAQNGDPLAYFADRGEMTDVRTAAVSAMVTKELGRTDETLGVIGAGIQGRLQARMHAEVLPLKRILIHDLVADRARQYASDMKTLLPGVEVVPCGSTAEVARGAKLIVTVTPAREPHLGRADLRPGTHINAVGADTPGKHELDSRILRDAGLLLVDSVAQCLRLGELQHAPDLREKAVEIGAFCEHPVPFDREAVTVCDMTGLGVEDLFIAQYCYERLRR